MDISFGQLYEGILSLERGVQQLERDIDNVQCDYSTKCLMEEELYSIKGQIDALLDMEMDFKGIDLEDVVDKINECLGCLELIFPSS